MISEFVLARSQDYFLDKDVRSTVIGQMVTFIAKSLEHKEGIRNTTTKARNKESTKKSHAIM
jgi:hypothetical protein